MNSQWKLVPIEPTQSILDAMTTERKKGNGVLQMWFEAMAAAPAPPEAHETPVCDHDWTDDGEFLLVCTKCGTQENHDPKWRDMESAPKDGTLIRLMVSFDEHSTEDADEAPTIGANNFDNDGEDTWRFAGWCWSHDHFTQGVGTPVGWLPMIEAGASTAELDRVTAERDALQQRLNAADQQIDELVELLRDAGGAVNGHAMTAWAIPLSKKIAAALNHTESRAGERCHEIPGTSGMRLNMLANQGE